MKTIEIELVKSDFPTLAQLQWVQVVHINAPATPLDSDKTLQGMHQMVSSSSVARDGLDHDITHTSLQTLTPPLPNENNNNLDLCLEAEDDEGSEFDGEEMSWDDLEDEEFCNNLFNLAVQEGDDLKDEDWLSANIRKSKRRQERCAKREF